MTTLLEPRGGPSALHEYRAATLDTMAVLSGYVHPFDALPDGSRPDVLRLRPHDGSLFVGDAKVTETPGNAETFGRLSRYAGCLAGWVAAGGSGALALLVPAVDANGWLHVLREFARRVSSGAPIPGHVDLIEVGTAVVWQPFVGVGA